MDFPSSRAATQRGDAIVCQLTQCGELHFEQGAIGDVIADMARCFRNVAEGLAID